jgi:hypothetical protein
MGQFAKGFDIHIKTEADLDRDIEVRIRALERRRR